MNIRKLSISALAFVCLISACKEKENGLTPDPVVTKESYIKYKMINTEREAREVAGVYITDDNKTTITKVLSPTESIGLVINAKAPGTYLMGNSSDARKASIWIMPGDGKLYGHEYFTDFGSCSGNAYTNGSVTITRYGAVGEYIEGKFSAKLYYRNGCAAQESYTFQGEFKVVRIK